MFRYGSGTHGLNEELGRRKECLSCDDHVCESVNHVLRECSVYSTLWDGFMCKLHELFRDRFEHFEPG